MSHNFFTIIAEHIVLARLAWLHCDVRCYVCRCRNDVYHVDLSEELVKGVCDGSTNCINARNVEWRFLDSRPDDVDLDLPDTFQFAWHCRAEVPYYLPLIVYNVNNGISAVTAGGLPATKVTDLGLQWHIPVDAIEHNGSSAPKQDIEVTIYDIDGNEDGTYIVTLDPDQISNCDSAPYGTVAEATAKDAGVQAALA